MAVARRAGPGTTQVGGVLSKFLRALTAGLVFAGLAAVAHGEGLAGDKRIAVTGADQTIDPAFAARAKHLNLKSASVLVVSQDDGHALYAKNTQAVVPIASITKLMTAMVTLDAQLGLDERVTISNADIDEIKGTRSRLKVGTALARGVLLHLALMSSENRAAAALSRAYPGGTAAFVAAMNQKAIELGMWRTRFVDSTGLSSDNVSTAEDLVKMVKAAYHYQLVRDFTTNAAHAVRLVNGRVLQYRNSNGLVKNPSWHIGLSKTGYISEAGRCLVMQAEIASRPVVIVLLDSWGKKTRMGDANRIKKWIESNSARQPAG
jgi:D-alanyl-D-alanine endopeptidase (penicillin-binding protein 7)